jgi:hypothetical protein
MAHLVPFFLHRSVKHSGIAVHGRQGMRTDESAALLVRLRVARPDPAHADHADFLGHRWRSFPGGCPPWARQNDRTVSKLDVCLIEWPLRRGLSHRAHYRVIRSQ